MTSITFFPPHNYRLLPVALSFGNVMEYTEFLVGASQKFHKV